MPINTRDHSEFRVGNPSTASALRCSVPDVAAVLPIHRLIGGHANVTRGNDYVSLIRAM